MVAASLKDSKRLRVVLDLSPLGARPEQRTGLGRMCEGLIAEMQRRPEAVEIAGVSVGSLRAIADAEAGARGLGVRWLNRPLAGYERRLLERSAQGGRLWPQLARAARLARQPVPASNLAGWDIFHSIFARIPGSLRTVQGLRFILTINDLTPFVLASTFPNDPTIGVLKRMIGSLRGEDGVMTISEFSKQDICRQFSIELQRVFVVLLAADRALFRPEPSPVRQQAVRRAYGLPDSPYFLTLHSLNPNKNVPFLINAYREFRRRHPGRAPALVVSGGRKQTNEEIRNRFGLEDPAAEGVYFTGFIANEDLAALYSGTDGFLFPSLYEGFGLPPLEAMQCGAAVAASDIASLPEVVGDAGLLLRPSDTEEWIGAMERLSSSSDLRKALGAKGIERASQFTWTRAVDHLLAGYQALGRR